MSGCKIIGIGASAGGLQALSTFFENIDPNTSGSYIVVQHLTRDRRSKLDVLLARKSHLPVVRVDDSMEMKDNHVYVMAEGTEIELHDNMIQVYPRNENEKINMAVNRLFFSMARHCKDRAIGVVLSGTGTDGLQGAKAIEDNGGRILVQSPDSAEFDGMPKAIINSDHPDYIDDPADLAKAVSHLLAEHP